MTKFTEAEFKWMYRLIRKHREMLYGKEEALHQLYNISENEEQRKLLEDLISRYNFFNEEICNLARLEMCKFIISLPYPKDECAVVAMCHDGEADSSQSLLDYLKVPLKWISDHHYHTINRFDHIKKNFKKGFKHFIVVDEFMGSGSTINNHLREFKKDKTYEGCTICFCIMAGMKHTADKLRKMGVDIFVAYEMLRGITDFYYNETLTRQIGNMKDIENKLATKIKEKNLEEFKFGFGAAESLFAIKYKNVPNNVFPIFWWERDINNKIRETLFQRYQNGY